MASVAQRRLAMELQASRARPARLVGQAGADGDPVPVVPERAELDAMVDGGLALDLQLEVADRRQQVGQIDDDLDGGLQPTEVGGGASDADKRSGHGVAQPVQWTGAGDGEGERRPPRWQRCRVGS